MLKVNEFLSVLIGELYLISSRMIMVQRVEDLLRALTYLVSNLVNYSSMLWVVVKDLLTQLSKLLKLVTSQEG